MILQNLIICLVISSCGSLQSNDDLFLGTFLLLLYLLHKTKATKDAKHQGNTYEPMPYKFLLSKILISLCPCLDFFSGRLLWWFSLTFNVLLLCSCSRMARSRKSWNSWYVICRTKYIFMYKPTVVHLVAIYKY